MKRPCSSLWTDSSPPGWSTISVAGMTRSDGSPLAETWPTCSRPAPWRTTLTLISRWSLSKVSSNGSSASRNQAARCPPASHGRGRRARRRSSARRTRPAPPQRSRVGPAPRATRSAVAPPAAGRTPRPQPSRVPARSSPGHALALSSHRSSGAAHAPARTPARPARGRWLPGSRGRGAASVPRCPSRCPAAQLQERLIEPVRLRPRPSARRGSSAGRCTRGSGSCACRACPPQS